MVERERVCESVSLRKRERQRQKKEMKERDIRKRYNERKPMVHDVKTATVAHLYGVATVSSVDKITGLFCRIASLL